MTELALRNVSKKFGQFAAVSDVSLRLEEGTFACFLGPSGCGKTTLLRLVAGLEIATAGEIALDGRDVTSVPAHRREIGMVFQSLALFPHLDVEGNITYGMRLRGATSAQCRKRADELLELIRLPGVGSRNISELSGGQRQRVAIARALALQPKLFLLDEPLSALDAKLREEMQVELTQLQRQLGVTTVMVTHDQSEAMTAADVLVVMNEGRIEQVGPPLEVYRSPKSRFVAGFVGANNLLPVKIVGKKLVAHFDTRITLDAIPNGTEVNDEVTISIRPEDLVMHRELRQEVPNRITASVSFVRDLGFEVEVFMAAGETRLLARCAPNGAPALKIGDVVQVELPPAKIRVFRK